MSNKKDKIIKAVNGYNFSNKNKLGKRRPISAVPQTKILVELTAVNESELPFYYSYKEVEWDDELNAYKYNDGEEGEEAICLPYPTPYCCLGDVVELIEINDIKYFEYPGKFSANTRKLNLSGKGALAWAFDGGFVVNQADLDAESPDPIKVNLTTFRTKVQDWFGIENNPFSTDKTIVQDSEVTGEERKVYVFNTLNTSFAGGTCKVIWGGSCWEIVLRTCED